MGTFLKTDFQQGGIAGIAFLGPGGSRPELPVEGVQLYVGLEVHLWEKDVEIDGGVTFIHVEGVVAGWDERRNCCFAKYDPEKIAFSPKLDGLSI